MSERSNRGQSGGINISGHVGSIGGDVVGGNKITNMPSAAELDGAFRQLSDVVSTAPTGQRAEAEAKLAELKKEAAKGKDADDGILAKLVDGLITLVPPATSAVVSAFTTPILSRLRKNPWKHPPSI
jgi:hypothetical protein